MMESLDRVLAHYAVGVIELWPRPLFLERPDLLSQGQIFNHELSATTTNGADRARPERHDENENTKHSGGVWSSLAVISSAIAAL